MSVENDGNVLQAVPGDARDLLHRSSGARELRNGGTTQIVKREAAYSGFVAELAQLS